MNWSSWLLWGFVATVVLTSIAATGKRLHLTRMNMPFMLGTMYTPDRDRATVLGLLQHFVNGWLFSLLYVLAFHSLDTATWWLGGLIGLVHVAFVLTVAIPALPHIHPRMASTVHGPDPARQLEPPAFLALNYGRRTPISMVFAHLVYGVILGSFYGL